MPKILCRVWYLCGDEPIFSLISFYHEPDTWLFGGIFKVLERMSDRYAVEITDELGGYVGRLKLSCAYRDRQTRPKLEGLYDKFEVKEVLSEPYTGRTFPGFENIDVSFDELQALVNRGRTDWKAPLSSVKGVYLISDVVAGKRYIGSAYSDGGIWARWREYALTGHGGNVELRALVDQKSVEYCRKAFRFTLLEHRSFATPDTGIIERESHWKRILMTRREMNRN